MWLQTFGDTHKFVSIMSKSVELPCIDARFLFQVNLRRRNKKSAWHISFCTLQSELRRFTDKLDSSKQKLNTESTLFCGKEFDLRYWQFAEVFDNENSEQK